MAFSNRNTGLGLGFFALILIVISKIIEITSGTKEYIIAWGASAVIASSYTFIRYRVIDIDKFSQRIKLTNLFGEVDLDPSRYLKWMNIAMIVGFVATVVIYYQFIVGMLIYLVMHICLIYAFSGIFSINPKKYLQDGTSAMKNTVLFSIVFWSFTIVSVFKTFVYNGNDSLIVVPYVILLGTMAHFTWYGLNYTGRSSLFRWMTVLGAIVFVFSDSLIGNMVFGGQTGPDWIYLLIDITYVLNIFLMSHAVLFFDIE